MDMETDFKFRCQSAGLCHVVFWHVVSDASDEPAVPISTAGVQMRATDACATFEATYHTVQSNSYAP